MKSEEQAIRELVETWLEATKRGDLTTVLNLMADDVVFMVPGQEPFGKEVWSKRMENLRVEGTSEIHEIKVFGDWAYLRLHLTMIVTPQSIPSTVLSGHSLAILRKGPDGRWVLARDANLVIPESETRKER